MTFRRPMREAKGDKSATLCPLNSRVCSRGQRAKTAMCSTSFTRGLNPVQASSVTHASTADRSLLQASRRLFLLPLHC